MLLFPLFHTQNVTQSLTNDTISTMNTSKYYYKADKFNIKTINSRLYVGLPTQTGSYSGEILLALNISGLVSNLFHVLVSTYLILL